MASPLYIAVDLGAGSGRVYLAGLDPGELLLEEIHRFQYPPTESDGRLRWDFFRIFDGIRCGLKLAGSRSRELGRSIQSLGVDSWAVDYGLLDAGGKLIVDPVCYRDKRTQNTMERVFAIVPRSEIFEKTGIQFQNFNTLFQLFSEGESSEKAEKILLLPDLINFFLTGKAVAEYTNATTTQMVNAATGGWDLDLLERLQLSAHILPKIVPAGTNAAALAILLQLVFPTGKQIDIPKPKRMVSFCLICQNPHPAGPQFHLGCLIRSATNWRHCPRAAKTA